MSDIDLYGDDVLNAVSERLEKLNVPNNDFINSAPGYILTKVSFSVTSNKLEAQNLNLQPK